MGPKSGGIETCRNVYHNRLSCGLDRLMPAGNRDLAGKNSVMQLTFKWAYNAVESKLYSCTLPIPDTCN